MRKAHLSLVILFAVFAAKSNALSLSSCEQTSCCAGSRGGISYCDSSAGRYVCKSGEYSNCYCSRHAVMDLQKLAGCCLWHGGVFRSDVDLVVCNDGSLSEECSIGNPAPSNAW